MIQYDSPVISGGDFTWGEYALLREWHVYAIPTGVQRANAILLFRQVQDLIRTPIGKAIAIASGARTAEYTQYLRAKGIPAAPRSAHNDWAAVDLRPPSGMTHGQFWQVCDAHWPGRLEVISATPGWVHLDTRDWGKKIRFTP